MVEAPASQVDSSNAVIPVVIVGAGLAALHVAARLPDQLLKDLVVVDPEGAWVQSYFEAGQRLEVGYVWNNIAQSPHKAPNALQLYMEKHSRLKETITSEPGVLPTPGFELFRDFCQEAVIGPVQSSVCMKRSRVVAIRALSAEELPKLSLKGGAVLELSSGERLVCKAVVYAANHVAPISPAWLEAALAAANELPEGSGRGSVRHASGVDLATAGVEGRRVAVVGGGMTGCHLALGALRHGAAEVTLISRRPLRRQVWKVDSGWLGNRRLQELWAEPDQRRRLEMCRRAKGPAALSPHIWEQMQAEKDAGRLRIFEQRGVASCSRHMDSSQGDTWHVELSWATPGAASQQAGQAAGPAVADVVWAALGSRYNVMEDPVLRNLQAECPTRIFGGYSQLDDEALAWPGLPLYLVGRGALLSMGPCAGNLPGMRMAADRIVRSIAALSKRLLTLKPPVLPWQRAAETIFGSGLGGKAGIGSRENGLEGALMDDSPLDGEGPMLMPKQQKVYSIRNPDLIEVDDLPASLPRVELQSYSWMDDGFELRIIMELPEAVPKDQVRFKFLATSAEMWAVGETAAYRLHIPKLYSSIAPGRCMVKVNKKKRKVFVVLHKIADAPWQFLKG